MTDFEESSSSSIPNSGDEASTSAASAPPKRPKRIPAPPRRTNPGTPAINRNSAEGSQPSSSAEVGATQAGSAEPNLSGPRVPTFPEAHLVVTAWPDPVLDQLGHDPRSAYVEKFWLSILGPSCLLLLRRLAAELEQTPDGFILDPLAWAQELGLGMKGGKHGPFWRSIERACRFGTAQRVGPALAVRRRLPPLTQRQIERLPTHLAQEHQVWLAERMNLDKRKTIAKWSDRSSPPELGSHREQTRGNNAA